MRIASSDWTPLSIRLPVLSFDREAATKIKWRPHVFCRHHPLETKTFTFRSCRVLSRVFTGGRFRPRLAHGRGFLVWAW